jgi:hypothetical protein
MNNIIATTVQISEDQVRISLAFILLFIFLAVISCQIKYESIAKMRLVNTLIILLALVPLLIIADAIRGKVMAIIALFLISYSAGNILFIKERFTKSNFIYAVMIIFTILIGYLAYAVIMFG